MTERRAIERLKEYAAETGGKALENSYQEARYQNPPPKSFVIGTRDGHVCSLGCGKGCAEPPEEALEALPYLEKIQVVADGSELLWLALPDTLRHLEIMDWNDEALPETWACEMSLETLYLDSQTGYVPKSFQRFKNLRQMGLDSLRGGTLVLPDWLNELEELQRLILCGCRVQSIPYSVVQTGLPFFLSGHHPRGVFLNDVSLQEGDIRLFAQPHDKIEAYYQQQRAYYHGTIMDEVGECKVIFLGDGAAGKSSLIDRIVHDRFNISSMATNGVKMTKWSTSVEGKPFTIRFLDFGGQEIMHSMHRCFLTDHTVYVVVCESREDGDIDLTAARWLETVKTFAKGCPVILALNKADINANVSVNEKDLKKRNPALKCVLKTSAKVGAEELFGVRTLTDAIRSSVPDCVDSYTYRAGEDWLGVKRDLENMGADYVPYISNERYRSICEERHITEPQMQRDMLKLFAELGVAYYYEPESGEDSDGYEVLNPEWLTNGIYRLILRTPEGGFLPQSEIRETLGKAYFGDIRETTYDERETKFILQVMRTFEISHKLDSGYEMLPMKMVKTPPEAADSFPKEAALHLKWVGAYLPNNFVHRLMIRKFLELDTNRVWRTGGVFASREMRGVTALAEMNEKALDLYVVGNAREDRLKPGETEQKRYLDEFRTEIQRIIMDLNLDAAEVVCYRADGMEGEIPYEDAMLQYYNRPMQDIYILGTEKWVRPDILLKSVYYDFEEKYQLYADRQRYRREEEQGENPTPPAEPETETALSIRPRSLKRFASLALPLSLILCAGAAFGGLLALSRTGALYGSNLMRLGLGGVIFTALAALALIPFLSRRKSELLGALRKTYGVECCDALTRGKSGTDTQGKDRTDTGRNGEP